MTNDTKGLLAGQNEGRGAYVLAATCDLNGCFRGKRVEAASLDKILKNGIRMPMSSIGVDIWGTDVFANSLTLDQGDLDGICEPTERGPIPLAWSATQAQFVPMWMRAETGEPFFGDPRRTLADILARFRAVQLTPVVATEVEFYLIDPKSPRAKPLTRMPTGHADAKDTIYSLEELAEVGPFLDDVYAMAAACGVAVDAATSESGPSQFEFNLVHGPDALEVADNTVFFKQIVRNMARQTRVCRDVHGQALSGTFRQRVARAFQHRRCARPQCVRQWRSGRHCLDAPGRSRTDRSHARLHRFVCAASEFVSQALPGEPGAHHSGLGL